MKLDSKHRSALLHRLAQLLKQLEFTRDFGERRDDDMRQWTDVDEELIRVQIIHIEHCLESNELAEPFCNLEEAHVVKVAQ